MTGNLEYIVGGGFGLCVMYVKSRASHQHTGRKDSCSAPFDCVYFNCIPDRVWLLHNIVVLLLQAGGGGS